MHPDNQRYSKSKRLRTRGDFLRVYRAGRRVAGTCFVIYVLACVGGPGRLGVSVGRRVGKAVVRNRIKRQLRERFRRDPAAFMGLDVVIEARPLAAQRLDTLGAVLDAQLDKALAVPPSGRGSGRLKGT